MAVALSSCASSPKFYAPDSVMAGKGKIINGVEHRETLCKKHRIPVEVIDGFRFNGLTTGTPWYEEAVIESPNIIGPAFSRNKSENYTYPSKAFQCPSCQAEYEKVRRRHFKR